MVLQKHKPRYEPRKRDTVYHSREFCKLRDEWYRKLEAEGFYDIETTIEEINLSDTLLEKGDYNIRKQLTLALKSHKPDFYQMCERYLEDGTFNTIEHRVWELHIQGVPQKKIAEEVRKTYEQVRSIVRRTRKAMMKHHKDINDIYIAFGNMYSTDTLPNDYDKLVDIIHKNTKAPKVLIHRTLEEIEDLMGAYLHD